MKISVITATYNAMQYLPALVESLRGQTDKDFEWVVADGASTDGTLEYLKSITDLNLKVISQEDFGIYDALNRGIKACSGEFYLVIGADDKLYEHAIKVYKAEISDDVDIITACIHNSYGVCRPKTRRPEFLAGMAKYVSNHAVGSIYRKKLHGEVGYYSKRFPIAADQFCLLSAVRSGGNIKAIESLVGFFSSTGVSNTDVVGTQAEIYRVHLAIGGGKCIHTCVFFLKLLRYWNKI